MKKCLSILLVILTFVSLTACVDQEYEYPVDFYFLRGEDNILYSESDGVITYETREAGRGDDLKYLLDLYFKGPADETLVSPFPEGLHVVSVYSNEGILELKLSDHFSSLTGIELTLACACIAKTCLAFETINAVNLKVNDENAEASRTIILTDNAIKFSDDTPITAMPASE